MDCCVSSSKTEQLGLDDRTRLVDVLLDVYNDHIPINRQDGAFIHMYGRPYRKYGPALRIVVHLLADEQVELP